MATWKLPPLPAMPKVVYTAPVSSSAGVEVTGANELLATMSLLPGLCVAGAMDGMFNSAEKIMATSKEEFVPVLSGDLKGSGLVRVSDEGDRIILSYGDPEIGNTDDYAIEQHENMSYHHTIGGPKYLERPLMAAIYIEEDISAGVIAKLNLIVPGATIGHDWNEIRVLHDESANLTVVKGYTTKRGSAVKPYARRRGRR